MRLSRNVFEVVVKGVFKMSSCRDELLRVDTTRHLAQSSRQSET